jgi:phage repressor protein C with HTH and peptisase S24 domain
MSKFTSFQIGSQVNNHNYKAAEFTSEYHILSLSGGKDSTALAFFMKENMQEIFEKTELVFCDTVLLDNLVLFTANGDSMDCPTSQIKDGGLVLVDTTANDFRKDGIYVISIDDSLFVKRL